MQELLSTITWERNEYMQYEIILMLLLFLCPAFLGASRQRLFRVWTSLFAFFLFLHRALLPFLVSGVWAFFLLGILHICFTLRPRDILSPGKAFAGALRRSFAEGNLFLLALILTVLLVQLCRINIAVDYDSLRYGLRSPYVLLSGGGISRFFQNPGLCNTVYTYPKGFELLTLPLCFLPGYSFVLCFNVWALIGILCAASSITVRVTGEEEAGLWAAFFCALIPGITNMSVTAKSDLLTLLCQLVFLCCVLFYAAFRRVSPRSLTKRDCVGLGLAALLFSYALKPTSLIFSSVLGAICLCVLLFFRYRRKKEGEAGSLEPLLPSIASLRVLSVSALVTGLCFYRTYRIAGLPMTSVFSGAFEALGFRLRYPFAAQSFGGGNGSGGGWLGTAAKALQRTFQILFFPFGEDMAHVRMAWGGPMLVLALCCAILFFRAAREKGKEDAALRGIRVRHVSGGQEKVPGAAFQGEGVVFDLQARCLPQDRNGQESSLAALDSLFAAFLAVSAVSFLTFFLLYQIDGNYYMLIYTLCACLGASALWLSRDRGEDGRTFAFSLPNGMLTVLFAALSLYATAFTGWAGAVGFTPFALQLDGDGISCENLLYYDHAAKARERQQEEGCLELISALEEEGGKTAHVIAFSDEPECYEIRCVTESYTDIAGSGGNVYLVKTLNLFKEYLSWSGTDYIYADTDWLSRQGNERAEELLSDLIDDGTLTELRFAGHFLYGTIDPERAAEPWETPLSEEKAADAALQAQSYQEARERNEQE